MAKNNKTQSSKILASILSKENITFEFSPKATTASVDLRSNHMVFPIFAQTTPEYVSQHLISHEASHVLNTDPKFLQVLDGIRPDNISMKYAKTVWNVIEDVRIEKRICGVYGGLSNIHHKSYDHLHNKMNMFQVDEDTVQDAGFISRINMHYKIGAFLDVPFSEQEQEIITEIDEMITQEDAYDITKKLLQIASESPSEESEDGEGEQEQESDGEGESGKGKGKGKPQKNNNDKNDQESGGSSESDSDDETESEDDDKSSGGSDEENEDEDEDESSGGGGSDEENEDEDEDESSGGCSDNEDENEDESSGGDSDDDSDDDSDEENGDREPLGPQTKTETDGFDMESSEDDIETLNVDYNALVDRSSGSLVISYTDIEQNVEPRVAPYMNSPPSGGIDYSDVQSRTKRFGNQAANIFLSKMRAFEYATSLEHRSGELNMGKLHQYRTSDNIFLADRIQRSGKNHGIAMFLDFSASMEYAHKLNFLMMQTLNFIEFCERLKLPFIIYTHSESSRYGYGNSGASSTAGVSANLRSPVEIVISSDMSKADIKTAKQRMASAVHYSRNGVKLVSHTAMHSTMVGAMHHTKMFKERHGIEIMHALCMTDGEDNVHPITSDGLNFNYYMEKDSVVVLPDGFTQLDFADINNKVMSIEVTAEVFAKYVGCDMTYLKFDDYSSSHNGMKKLSPNISYKENNFGFRKEFHFTAESSPTYDGSDVLEDTDSTTEQRKEAVEKAGRVSSDNSLFIKIFATSIAEGNFGG